MKALSDIRKAVAKKEARQPDPAKKKDDIKQLDTAIDVKKRELNNLENEFEHKKKEVFASADAIVQDASAKASSLLSQALRDGDEARDIKNRLTEATNQADLLIKENEKQKNDNEQKDAILSERENAIKKAEETVFALKEQRTKALTQSNDILKSLVLILEMALARMATMEILDQEGHESLLNITNTLSIYSRKLNEKEGNLNKKEQELEQQAIILKDTRTQLNNAERELRRRNK